MRRTADNAPGLGARARLTTPYGDSRARSPSVAYSGLRSHG